MRNATGRLQLVWKMDYGQTGSDTDVNTPMARAVSHLFRTGKPFSNLCMCFFKDTSDVLRWFGVFVKSAGNRIVFFPGFINRFDRVKSHNGNTLQPDKLFNFDHISLEADRSKWHVTSGQSEDHLPGSRTLPLSEDSVLWLGLSVADINVMRIVKQDTEIAVDCPHNDSRRRYEVFRKTRDGAKFPIMSLNEEVPVAYKNWFLHFGIIVGLKGFETYSGGNLGFPYNSPYLTTPFPKDLTNLPLRTHTIELSDNTDIQIIACRLPGGLKTPVAITSLSEPVSP